jgi:RimJ/RimL family protein N-acetyltransferase
MSEIDVYPDYYGGITDMVRLGLGYSKDWPGDEFLSFGFFYNKKLIGALVFHDLRRHTEVWWTIYTVDKRWCTRKVLRLMFTIAFGRMDCRRISVLVSKNNLQSLNLVRRLGFKEEGLLRQCREDGEDCYILGMLRSECPWINFKGDEK